MSDLPRIIPLFPLPNLVLFPGVQVPLHIFEPRYREMIAEVGQSDGIIGMTMLKDAEQELSGAADIFEIGCAGHVEALVKLPDGRYNLTLAGLGEFRVLHELRDRSYRRGEIEWCPATPARLELDQELYDGLRELLFSYLGEPAHQAWNALVTERGLRGAELINFLCFHLDITPLEKQTLLEARDARVDCLFDVLMFKLEERKLGPAGGGPGSSDLMQ